MEANLYPNVVELPVFSSVIRSKNCFAANFDDSIAVESVNVLHFGSVKPVDIATFPKLTSSSAVQKANKLLEDATQAEKEAVSFYMEAISHFQQAIKYEDYDKESKQYIKKICDQCEERVEALNGGETIVKERNQASVMSLISAMNYEKRYKTEEPKPKLHSAIVREEPNVRWEDIAGLCEAKACLEECTYVPSMLPHLYYGNRKPWRSILLYGPPGTGKTSLAKALATKVEFTFFSISASELVSNWPKESRQMIDNLFKLAALHKPSIVFVDDIDSICCARKEYEGDIIQRTKGEFLVKMKEAGEEVLVLAATNCPWNLDSDFRRRFEKQLYIPMPTECSRKQMFELHIGNMLCDLQSEDIELLARMTEGYSGSNISRVVQEALMVPMRTVKCATHFKKVRGPNPSYPTEIIDDLYTPCSPSDPGAIEMTWMNLPNGRLLEPRIAMRDFEISLEQYCRPQIEDSTLKKFSEFMENIG